MLQRSSLRMEGQAMFQVTTGCRYSTAAAAKQVVQHYTVCSHNLSFQCPVTKIECNDL